jgi:hypothetical protein
MDYLALTLPGGQAIQPPGGIKAKGGMETLGPILSNGLTLMITAAVVLTLIFIVLGGIQWASSGGDKGKIAAARARLTWAIIGLIITVSVFFILSFIGYLFKVDLLTIGF